MLRTFNALPAGGDMADTLYTCYKRANEEALNIQSEDEREAGGSTITAVYIRGDECVFLSSGDSRIYLCRGGSLIQLSRDQNMGALLDVRAGLGDIDWSMAKSAMGRSSLTGHLGMNGGQPCDISP
ncbi:MAG: hypothetical protein Q4C54_08620 [Clostridia bacterium]|nr:hypothetical protein [Clostridia bacterium]